MSMLFITRSCRRGYYSVKINIKEKDRFFVEEETVCKDKIYSHKPHFRFITTN